MSTAFSKRMQGVATRLLSKYGSAVTVIRPGQKVWDPVLGEYVVGPETREPLAACVPVPVAVGLVNEKTIQSGDMILRMDWNGGKRPVFEDRYEFDGEVWATVNIDLKMVNDDPVAWLVQVRK